MLNFLVSVLAEAQAETFDRLNQTILKKIVRQIIAQIRVESTFNK